MTRADGAERIVRRIVSLLLRLYPRRFRDEYGTDIEDTTVDRFRAARERGRRAALALVARAVLDALTNGPAERFGPPHERITMFYWQDFRYAVRLLRRSPYFTLLTVVVLGGGLGLSIFTYSFLHTAMLRAIPVDGGDRIVRVQLATGNGAIDAADLARARPSVTTLASIGAYAPRDLVIGTEGTRRVLHATAAEWSIFQTTRTRPRLGRGFRADDELDGAEPVIVLGYRTWQTVLGGDPAILNSIVTLNGTRTRVIGVMPEGYGFPVAAEAWIPLEPALLRATDAGVTSLEVYGRLADGASSASAQSELETLLDRARTSRAVTAEEKAAPRTRVTVQSFPMAQVGEEAPLILAVLNLLAVLVLLLACINVTNLLLASANERARETAVRLALGASRARLIVQSLWESVILCVAGGVLATLLAAWGLAAIDAWARVHLEGNLAFWWTWGIDRTTLVAAGAFVTITLAALGGVIAARVTSTRFNLVMQDGGARSGGRREGRFARVLVATQVTTVSVLMFVGVMCGIIAYRVAHTDVGYDTRNLLSSSITLPDDRYPTTAKRAALFHTVYDAMSRSPVLDGALLRAGLATASDAAGEFTVRGATPALAAAKPRAYIQSALGSLALGGAVVRDGRALDERDGNDAPAVAVISRALATRYWPGSSAVGQRIVLTGLGERQRERTVVGVVSDVLMGDPLSRERSALAIYVPMAQSEVRSSEVVFRHRGDAAAAQGVMQQAVADADRLLVPSRVMTFDEVLDKLALVARSVAKLFAISFGFALLLAVSGTYGLMARSIGQRTREIGVRRALGATDGAIVRLLLGQGSRQLGVGALVAIPAMLAIGAGVAHYFPVGIPLSIASGAAVTATIVGVVLVATYVPTRRTLSIAVRDALGRD